MKQALLVIDMQKGSFNNATPRFDADGVIERINKLTSIFRAQKLPVFYIQHDGTGTGEFEKHSLPWENLDELIVHSKDLRIDKYANDVFYRSLLQSELKKLKVQELIITGCATDFCIESTIQSALTKDYHIIIVKDGHTTADRPHLSAQQIIVHYNWVWANMIPTKGQIQVKSFKELEKQFND